MRRVGFKEVVLSVEEYDELERKLENVEKIEKTKLLIRTYSLDSVSAKWEIVDDLYLDDKSGLKKQILDMAAHINHLNEMVSDLTYKKYRLDSDNTQLNFKIKELEKTLGSLVAQTTESPKRWWRFWK